MSEIAATAARNPRYTGVAIALHWLIALAIILLILVGWYMGDLPDDAPGKEGLYQLHKSFGITVLILTLARIGWRVMNPPPPLPDDYPAWETALSKATHFAFYALMIAMPLTGWMLVSTAYQFDVATVLFGVVSWPDLPLGFLANETGHGAIEFVHSKLAWLAIGLIALHVAGAVKHEIADARGVFGRMLPGLFENDPPQRAPRGGLFAFGGAIAFFLLVAAVPALSAGGGNPGREAPAAPAAGDANWQVIAEDSEIAFSGTHSGETYTGSFRDWQADIRFWPDRLDESRVSVTVETGSAVANQKTYTDSLKGPEWFDVRDFPTATVELTGFEETGDGYRADATLNVKESTVTVPFTFTLEIEGDEALMQGRTDLSRAALNLGMASDPGFDWVAETVEVEVTVRAIRQAD